LHRSGGSIRNFSKKGRFGTKRENLLDRLEHLPNIAAGTKNELRIAKGRAMLALISTLLFALAALAAVLTLVDCVIAAHRAFAQLMCEKALLQAGLLRPIDP
jgi:hypothetical protein